MPLTENSTVPIWAPAGLTRSALAVTSPAVPVDPPLSEVPGAPAVSDAADRVVWLAEALFPPTTEVGDAALLSPAVREAADPDPALPTPLLQPVRTAQATAAVAVTARMLDRVVVMASPIVAKPSVP